MKYHKDESFNLLRRKGVYPYDWMDDASKFSDTSLPPKSAFYNKLNNNHIPDDDYKHAKLVWDRFNCKTFKD